MLPDEIARRCVDRLNNVSRVGEIHDAVVGQRRALLAAWRHATGPDQPQLADIVAGDLVERTVAPPVERTAPHEPVAGGRVLEHRVGHRHELGGRLGVDGGSRRRKHPDKPERGQEAGLAYDCCAWVMLAW